MHRLPTLIAAIAAGSLSIAADAAPGDLDTTYGLSGKSFASVNGADASYANAVAIQPDGKIVVAGKCFVLATGSTQICALRLLPNGFFDTSFGNNGSKLVNVGGTGVTEVAHAIALQSDGKIVLAGSCGPETAPTETCLVRLLADGSLDGGFGLSGKSRISFGTVGMAAGIQEARAIAVLADGKLLLGGRCRGDTLATVGVCVVRLNSNGSLDTAYANSGRTIAVNALDERLTSMLVRADGRVLIATEGNNSLPPAAAIKKVYVSQLTVSGAWDNTFGNLATTGTQVLELCTQNKLPRMALQPDGKVIVALVCNNGGDIQAGKRLDIAGQIDPAYNYPGGTPFGVPVESGEYGLKPVLQADGRTVFAASSYNVAPNPVTLDFLTWRAGDTGTLDATYTGGGLKPMQAASDRANDAALQTDGKLVLAGTCDNGASFQICTARLQGDASSAARNCSMDIDGDGRVLPTTDALILARASLGLSGAAVLNGIATTGPRNTWPLIRDFLVNQCGMSNLAP